MANEERPKKSEQPMPLTPTLSPSEGEREKRRLLDEGVELELAGARWRGGDNLES